MENVLYAVGILLLYFAVAASTALGCRMLIKIPDELFRKILHSILLGSLLIFVFCFPDWLSAALGAVGFAVAVYPLLMLLERVKNFSRVTTERKKGELKASLLLVFGMFAAVISVCWGWLGDRWLVLASVYAWGWGDAAAALAGKRWGKHKIHLGPTDGKKSIEGSAAMFLTSLFSVAVILLCRGGLGIAGYLVIPPVTAFASTIAELYSKDGYDTVICPLCAMAVLLPLIYLFGGLA